MIVAVDGIIPGTLLQYLHTFDKRVPHSETERRHGWSRLDTQKENR
jgi:hypothetical protein